MVSQAFHFVVKLVDKRFNVSCAVSDHSGLSDDDRFLPFVLGDMSFIRRVVTRHCPIGIHAAKQKILTNVSCHSCMEKGEV